MGFDVNTDSAPRRWIRAAIFVFIVLAGLALLLLAPELDANPLTSIQPG